ncbi:MAG TPA: hypothetical protein VGJ15_12930 [Pirellulales bacterium]
MAKLSRGGWLALNYAATIFISAFLLFQVQPLVSKYILPWFGGSPAVWTTCMLFFQTVLFAGYAYAHFTQQWFRPKLQALIHLAIILMALVLLRVVPDESWKPRESIDPIGRILLLLAFSVGLPYFVLSTTGPLLQAWFAKSFPGKTPYRLYALSNFGSLLALLSYPIFFERRFDVAHQAGIWSWGFWGFAVLCGAAALNLWIMFSAEGSGITVHNSIAMPAMALPVPSESEQAAQGLVTATPNEIDDHHEKIEDRAPHWWQRILWLALPAFACVALLATTNHVCTDVAVMPFLWVIPLSLYLLTFIIAFDHPRWYRPTPIALLTVLAIYGVGIGKGETDVFDCGLSGKLLHWASDRLATWRGLPMESYPASPEITIGLVPYLILNFVAMWGICMLCHGELVRQRPHPRYLTAFYLLISAGGALGAMAVTLLAPHIFNTFYEWELTTFIGYLLCVGIVLWAVGRWAFAVGGDPPARNSLRMLWLAPLVVVAAIGWIDLSNYLGYTSNGVLFRTRNFFGTLLVREFEVGEPDHYIVFKHGATTHGMQFAAADKRGEPTTYYTPYGGVGRTINYLHGLPQAPPVDEKSKLDNLPVLNSGAAKTSVKGLKIGAVGLGTGTLAAYAEPGDSISFYEINPAVVDIANDDKWFTFLTDCRQRGAQCETKLGDARLTMENELRAGKPQHFDLLVLDAFSGDAIPVHLLTEEAFEKIYLPHLATAAVDGRDGTIAIHITNHYVDLEPVIRGLAERFGFESVRIENPKIHDQAIFHADWIILSRNKALIAALASYGKTPELSPDQAPRTVAPAKPAILWTDGRSNLFDVLK